MRSSTRRPARAQRAIEAPSESTPSSECGERTTIGFTALSSRPWLPANRTSRRRAGDGSSRHRSAVDFARSGPPSSSDGDGVRRGSVIFAASRRSTPNWGYERGTPIDRVYVERFVGAHAARHPRARPRDRSSRLHDAVRRRRRARRHPHGDRGEPGGDDRRRPRRRTAHPRRHVRLRDRHADAAVHLRRAGSTEHRSIAFSPPDGVLLATVPGLTKISRIEDELFGEWWHYTGRSVRRLAEEAFGVGNVEVETYGNVLAASGFLYGLAASDLTAPSSTRTTRSTRSSSGSGP